MASIVQVPETPGEEAADETGDETDRDETDELDMELADDGFAPAEDGVIELAAPELGAMLLIPADDGLSPTEDSVTELAASEPGAILLTGVTGLLSPPPPPPPQALNAARLRVRHRDNNTFWIC